MRTHLPKVPRSLASRFRIRSATLPIATDTGAATYALLMTLFTIRPSVGVQERYRGFVPDRLRQTLRATNGRKATL